MKVTYRMMVAEFLLMLILTFMLSLGHIIVSNVFSMDEARRVIDAKLRELLKQTKGTLKTSSK